MKRIIGFLSALLLIWLPVSGTAQPLSVDLSLFNSQAQVFYVGDLGFTGFGSVPDIFSLTLSNNSGSAVEMQLHFEMRLNQTPIAEAFSNRFNLPPGTFVFTSSQLNTGSAVIPGTNIALDLSNYSLNFDQIENLRNQILTTGKLPAGQYDFFIEIIPFENGTPLPPVPDGDQTNNVLTISNPTTLELVYPGERVSAAASLIEVPSPYPYFLWQSDASLFNLFVYEKYPGDQTIQDVLSHDPVLQIEGYPNQVYNYPPDPSPEEYFDENGNRVGQSVIIRPLEAGETYYWYVQAIVLTASGETTLSSEVFQFKVATTDESMATSQMILNYLQQILGSRYEEFMQALSDYTPDGNILLNSTPVTPEALIDMINAMNKNEITIQNITIE